jgi:hypothetical protein
MIKPLHPAAWKAVTKLALAAALAVSSGFAAADEGKGTLIFPWEAHGKLYATGPKTLMILGEIEGTLYAAETGKGMFDGATIVCPMLHEVDVEKKSVRGEGRCNIFPKGSDDMIFATYTCLGEVGSCEGVLELTAGTGEYEGITGLGAISSRTGVADLALKLGPGGSITNAEGLMKITGFACTTR